VKIRPFNSKKKYIYYHGACAPGNLNVALPLHMSNYNCELELLGEPDCTSNTELIVSCDLGYWRNVG